MSDFRVKGWHVLVVILAFFGVTIAVNATFITLAVTTFSGEVSSEPYVQGLNFNETLQARAAQAELGWTAEIAHEATDGGRRVEVRILDRDGDLVRRLDVTGVLGRPAAAAEDRALVFIETGDAYVSQTDAAAPGEWALRVVAARDDRQVFEVQSRLWAQ